VLLAPIVIFLAVSPELDQEADSLGTQGEWLRQLVAWKPLENNHYQKLRSLPFLFASGYGTTGLLHPFQDRPVLRKPFLIGELHRAIELFVP
jgi:hypothetical protein